MAPTSRLPSYSLLFQTNFGDRFLAFVTIVFLVQVSVHVFTTHNLCPVPLAWFSLTAGAGLLYYCAVVMAVMYDEIRRKRQRIWQAEPQVQTMSAFLAPLLASAALHTGIQPYAPIFNTLYVFIILVAFAYMGACYRYFTNLQVQRSSLEYSIAKLQTELQELQEELAEIAPSPV